MDNEKRRKLKDERDYLTNLMGYSYEEYPKRVSIMRGGLEKDNNSLFNGFLITAIIVFVAYAVVHVVAVTYTDITFPSGPLPTLAMVLFACFVTSIDRLSDAFFRKRNGSIEREAERTIDATVGWRVSERLKAIEKELATPD